MNKNEGFEGDSPAPGFVKAAGERGDALADSLWRVALTMATSRMEIEVLLLTLAMLMLVWSLTAPRAFRILLGAIACDDDYEAYLGFGRLVMVPVRGWEVIRWWCINIGG
ncbi:uncharacterized protein A4U43_UnF6140 [Asparagus officinalis]|uniref:Uncharacterized protein n=1 Tax=Asparagus officinalis TaxID=4686 RepID=A0A1R3L6I8_ASPOF|nr:uncharacterized protein A4U43_UnF6140 [Asparagus officinalis]